MAPGAAHVQQHRDHELALALEGDQLGAVARLQGGSGLLATGGTGRIREEAESPQEAVVGGGQEAGGGLPGRVITHTAGHRAASPLGGVQGLVDGTQVVPRH